MDCPACGGGKVDPEALDSHNEYKLYHCRACDLMFWYPMKGTDPEWYETSLDLTIYRPMWLAHWSQRQFFKDMPECGGKLLDVGCGAGDFLFAAQRAGYTVAGVDFSPGTIEVARRRFGLQDMTSSTLENYVADRSNEKFDVITCFEVLEHLENVREFLPLVKKLLKPGGFLACSVPNRDKWRFIQIPEECDYPPNHLTRWNLQALWNLFDRSGFSVLTVKPQPLLSFDQGWFYQVSNTLHIHQLATVLAKGLVGNNANQANIPQGPPVTKSSTVARMGMGLYVKAVLPALGVVSLPVWVLLRRQGAVIYLLAKM